MKCDKCGSSFIMRHLYHYGQITDQSTSWGGVDYRDSRTTTSYKILGTFEVGVCLKCLASEVVDGMVSQIKFRGVKAIIMDSDTRGWIIIIAVVFSLGNLVGRFLGLSGMKIALFLMCTGTIWLISVFIRDIYNDEKNHQKNIKLESLSKGLGIAQGLVALTDYEYRHPFSVKINQ